MTKIIAYQFEGNIAVTTPAPGLDIDYVAKKDVPFGCPYVIVDPLMAGEVNFEKPDGIGEGEV
jgi:hypothetical protein